MAEIQAWVRRDATEAVASEAPDVLDSEIDSANQAAQLGAEPIYEGRIARLFDRLTDSLMADVYKRQVSSRSCVRLTIPSC